MSPGLIEHFTNPRNVGELGEPAHIVEVMNPICGDILRLSARVEDGVITDVAYKARGCTASIACGSALTGLLHGIAVSELPQLKAARIESAVGGLSNESKHAAVLCADAVKALFGCL